MGVVVLLREGLGHPLLEALDDLLDRLLVERLEQLLVGLQRAFTPQLLFELGRQVEEFLLGPEQLVGADRVGSFLEPVGAGSCRRRRRLALRFLDGLGGRRGLARRHDALVADLIALFPQALAEALPDLGRLVAGCQLGQTLAELRHLVRGAAIEIEAEESVVGLHPSGIQRQQLLEAVGGLVHESELGQRLGFGEQLVEALGKRQLLLGDRDLAEAGPVQRRQVDLDLPLVGGRLGSPDGVAQQLDRRSQLRRQLLVVEVEHQDVLVDLGRFRGDFIRCRRLLGRFVDRFLDLRGLRRRWRDHLYPDHVRQPMGVRVAVTRRRQQPLGGGRMAGALELMEGLGDELQVAGVDIQRRDPQLDGVVGAAVAEQQGRDLAELRHRLLGALCLTHQLGEAQTVAGVVRLELDQLAIDGDGGLGVAMLLVIVGDHLILGSGLVEQSLAAVQIRQPLVDLDLRRVETDDLLVDGDRLDEEALADEVVGGPLEQGDRLVEPIQPHIEVAHPIQGGGVVGAVGEQLAVLVDGGVQLAAGNEFLGVASHLVAVQAHRPDLCARRGRTERKVRRCSGEGPYAASASRCSGAP